MSVADGTVIGTVAGVLLSLAIALGYAICNGGPA